MSGQIQALLMTLLLLAPGVVQANTNERAAQAYREFQAAYQALPTGVCEEVNAAPVKPYRVALDKLNLFEQAAASIPNRPDLTPHRSALQDIVDSGKSPCKDPFAGATFLCNGPCPKPQFRFVQTPELPRFNVVLPNNERPQLNGYTVTRANFDSGGWVQKLSNGYWYEFNRSGQRIFRFEETGRDEGSVYLNDTSRNIQLQVDLRRKMVSVGGDFGPKRDLYRVTRAFAER